VEPEKPRKQLPEQVVLNYRVDLLKTAPVGPIGGALEVIVPGYPVFMLVKGAKVQLSGEVVGHMKVTPADVLTLGTITQGKGATGRVSINVVAPVSLDDLRVTSPNPHLSVRFVPAAPPADGSAQKAIGATNAVDVEVTLDAATPPSRIFERVVVSDVKNGERLEIRVYATVIP
jgi:hypothetical protein